MNQLEKYKEFMACLTNHIELQCYKNESFKQIKIRILTSYAAFFLKQAIQEPNPEQKEKYFQGVKSNLNKSDKIEINEKASFVLKGYFFFYQSEFQQSNNYFDNAKETDPNYVPCIFGRACIEYAKKNYQEALKLYKNALRLNPNGAPEMRLGLGYCYYQLDNIELALKAFESVIVRDKHNVQAIIAIAVICRKLERYDQYYE